jgi:hypothetical protein
VTVDDAVTVAERVIVVARINARNMKTARGFKDMMRDSWGWRGRREGSLGTTYYYYY